MNKKREVSRILQREKRRSELRNASEEGRRLLPASCRGVSGYTIRPPGSGGGAEGEERGGGLRKEEEED